MDYNLLNKELINNYEAKEKKIKNISFKVKNLTILKLRDILLAWGYICKEDLEKKIYIAQVRSGFLKMNKAIIILNLSDDELKVAVYAEEGLFGQKTSEGVLNELKGRIGKYI